MNPIDDQTNLSPQQGISSSPQTNPQYSNLPDLDDIDDDDDEVDDDCLDSIDEFKIFFKHLVQMILQHYQLIILIHVVMK